MKFKKLYISDENYIDFENAKIVIDSESYQLTETELYLLESLAENVNNLVRYETISNHIDHKKSTNGQIYESTVNYVNRDALSTRATELRKKSRQNLKIANINNMGYKLVVAQEFIEKSVKQFDPIPVPNPVSEIDTDPDPNPIPEPNPELLPEKENKFVRFLNKNKIVITIISLVLVVAIIVSTIWGVVSKKSVKSGNENYHISITKPDTITDIDLNTLEERIKIFSDGEKYSMDITDTKIELYLPISAFAENDIEYVLNAYLIRPINLYAFDSESKNPKDNIFIDRDDINKVKVLNGPIEGVDAAKYEIGTENYKYFSVTLNDDFVSKNKSKLDEYGKNFTFAQDIDNANGFYHYYTFPQEDGKTFYILNNDLSNNFVNLLEYNLTHEGLSVSLNDYVIDINSKATWQNIENTNVVGSNQCNFDDFSEGTITLSYRAYSSFSEGENLDTEKAFKQRFDVLGNKYAFGSYADESNTFYIVKTTVDNLNFPIINLIGNHPNIVIRNETSEYTFQYDIVNVIKNGVNNRISFSPKYYDNFEKGELEEFIYSVNESKDSTIYMFADNMPVMSTDISNIDINSGAVSFDKICQMENGKVLYTDITSDYTYFADIMSAIAKTNENMENFSFAEYQFNINSRGNLPTENQFNLKYDSYDEELVDKITELCPDAKVNVKDFSVYVSLNLPIDDNLVSNSITISKQIYNAVNLEDSMINNISIYLVNEDDAVMERGRIFFTKDLKTSYSEGSIRVHGIFVNGRLEKYKDEFKKAIENDDLISNLNQDEYAWNFEGFNQ